MKLFWKIFFAFTALITIIFSVFGIWLITQTFHNSLEKEIEEGNRENRMFQLAFEVNMNSLPDNYKTEKILSELGQSVIANLDNEEYSYKIFRTSHNLIYESNDSRLGIALLDQLEDRNCIYQVLESDGRKYLIFVCKSVMGNRVYFLESLKDITALYLERDGFYSQYRVVMLVLIIATGIIVFILSHLLTRSVVNLSNTTRKLASGQYDVRADILGEDEIGTLALDFNVMADNLTQKMTELSDNARKQEDFTASFAHELKTPLTSIIGYADMLRTMNMTKEETMEAANYIYSQGKRLESLSYKLLELIVTKNQEHQFKLVNVPELMEQIKLITANNLEKKQITMITEIEAGEIFGEKDLLISLVANLIDNARKALPERGKIWIKGIEKENIYELTIRDNGCGMPQNEIDKITEAFYMVDKSRSRKEGGAGLGMTLCSRIIEVHQAKWVIESKEGEGTTITLIFFDQNDLQQKDLLQNDLQQYDLQQEVAHEQETC